MSFGLKPLKNQGEILISTLGKEVLMRFYPGSILMSALKCFEFIVSLTLGGKRYSIYEYKYDIQDFYFYSLLLALAGGDF